LVEIRRDDHGRKGESAKIQAGREESEGRCPMGSEKGKKRRREGSAGGGVGGGANRGTKRVRKINVLCIRRKDDTSDISVVSGEGLYGLEVGVIAWFELPDVAISLNKPDGDMSQVRMWRESVTRQEPTMGRTREGTQSGRDRTLLFPATRIEPSEATVTERIGTSASGTSS
jgi:hypothetical protein